MNDQEKRMADNYEITTAFWIDGKEIIFGIDESNTELPYLVSDCTINPIFGCDEYQNSIGTADYLEALQVFSQRVSEAAEKSVALRRERGVNESLTSDDCIEGIRSSQYTNQMLVIKPDVLQRDKRTADYQLIYATHGNGCSPNAIGISVFGVEVFDRNKHVRYSRADILGIIKPECIPDWAKERLAAIQAEWSKSEKPRQTER